MRRRKNYSFYEAETVIFYYNYLFSPLKALLKKSFEIKEIEKKILND